VALVHESDAVRYDRQARHGIEWEDKRLLVIKAQDIVLIE